MRIRVAMSRSFPAALACALAFGTLAACTEMRPAPEVPGEQIGHTISGTAFKTFDAPLAAVRVATVSVVHSRGLQLSALGSRGSGETILASGAYGALKIELDRKGKHQTTLKVDAVGGGGYGDYDIATKVVADVARLLKNESK